MSHVHPLILPSRVLVLEPQRAVHHSPSPDVLRDRSIAVRDEILDDGERLVRASPLLRRALQAFLQHLAHDVPLTVAREPRDRAQLLSVRAPGLGVRRVADERFVVADAFPLIDALLRRLRHLVRDRGLDRRQRGFEHRRRHARRGARRDGARRDGV